MPANAGDARDMGLISGPGKSPGVGSGNPLQNSCLENPVDSGAQGLQAMEATETQRGLRTQYTQKVSGRAQTPAGELWPSHWCTALHLHHLRVCVCFGGRYWRVVMKKALTMRGKYFEVTDYGGYLVLKAVSYQLKG